MNIPEFSTEFDVLFNNITSNQAPGLNEYEKSVFLTKAQSQLINEYFNNRTDGVGGGFDGSQKRQYEFSSLINTVTLTPTRSVSKLDERSVTYIFPSDYFLSVNEIIKDGKYQYSIFPITYAEYQTLMLKPYNFPVKRAVWRLFTTKVVNSSAAPNIDDILFIWPSTSTTLRVKPNTNKNLTHLIIKLTSGSGSPSITYEDGVVTVTIGTETFDSYTSWEDVCGALNSLSDSPITFSVESSYEEKNTTSKEEIIYSECFTVLSNGSCPVAEIIGRFRGPIIYTLRYIKRPTPIILEDLTNYGTDLTIGGEFRATPCELPEETHQEILERAVTLAKIAWQGGTATQAASQQRNNNQ